MARKDRRYLEIYDPASGIDPVNDQYNDPAQTLYVDLAKMKLLDAHYVFLDEVGSLLDGPISTLPKRLEKIQPLPGAKIEVVLDNYSGEASLSLHAWRVLTFAEGTELSKWLNSELFEIDRYSPEIQTLIHQRAKTLQAARRVKANSPRTL